jgi:hypothetical protein
VDQVTFFPEGFLGWIDTYPSMPVQLRGPLDDPDRDGHTNLMEYFQNTSPGNANESGGMSVPVFMPSGQFTAQFRRNKITTDLTATIQWTPNLTNWASSGQALSGTVVTMNQSVDTSPADHDVVTITGVATGSPLKRLFLRLHVLQN